MPQIPITINWNQQQGIFAVPNVQSVPWGNVGGLSFQLGGGGLSWAANGIEFGSDWTGKGLPQASLSGGNYIVNYNNNNMNYPGTYKYTIHINKGTLDPEIINDPPTPEP